MPCPLMAIITGKEFAVMCLPPRLIDKWCWWHSERKCYWNTPEILIQTLDSQFIFQFLMLWKAIEIRYPVDLFNTTASARQHVEEFALMPLSPKLMFMALWNKMLLKAPKLTIRPLILNSPFSFASMKGNKILYTGECCFRAHALLILVMQRSSSGTVVVVFFFRTQVRTLCLATYDCNVIYMNLVIIRKILFMKARADEVWLLIRIVTLWSSL